MPDSPPVDSGPEPEVDALAAALAANAALPEPPAEPPAQPTPTPEPAPQPSPEPAAPTPPAAPEPTPASPEPTTDDLQLTKFIDQGWGTNLAGKYQDDNAAITGLVHAAQLASRRDTDAEYGRAVREHEPAFRQFLSQQGQQGQPAQAPPVTEQPPSWEQIQAWRAEVARSGENVSPEASRGLQQAQLAMERAAYQLAYQPEKIIAPVVDPRVTQQTNERIDQRLSDVGEQQWVQQFEAQHKDWIYRGGQSSPENLTQDGQRLLQYAKFEQQRGRTPADALRYAYLSLHAERTQQAQQQQQPVPTQPVTPAAQHQPAVAAPPGGDPEEEYQQYLKKGDLEATLAQLARHQDAAAGQMG